MRELSAGEVAQVAGGYDSDYDWFDSISDWFRDVWNDWTTDDYQDIRVDAFEDMGWDCYEQNNDRYICYDEDREWQAVIYADGTTQISEYGN